jgi:hypothetical protein
MTACCHRQASGIAWAKNVIFRLAYAADGLTAYDKIRCPQKTVFCPSFTLTAWPPEGKLS